MSYGSVTQVPAPGRVNGFSRPFTDKQLLFWSSNSGSAILFYAIVATFIMTGGEADDFNAYQLFKTLVATHACIASLGFSCWLFIECHNPVEPTCFGAMLPNTKRWTDKKWCREHKTKLEGLDHFCIWLNVSISRSNYVPFLTLTVCGVCQYILQAVFGVLLLTLWREEMVEKFETEWEGGPLVFAVAVVLNEIVSVGIGFGFVMLLIFHIHLLSTGFSTYTYLIEQRRIRQPPRQTRASQNSSNDPSREALNSGGAINVPGEAELV